jgi:hypothetical protein
MAVHIELRRGFRRLDLPPAKGHELRAEVLDRFQPARQKPLSGGSLGHVPGGAPSGAITGRIVSEIVRRRLEWGL